MKLCDHCQLAFHVPNVSDAPAACGCLKYGCGCRAKREQKEAA